MPGPSNTKNRKAHSKKTKRSKAASRTSSESQDSQESSIYQALSCSPPSFPPQYSFDASEHGQERVVYPLNEWTPKEPIRDFDTYRDTIPQEPYIYDPGNGARVRNTRQFLSSYFAQPPTLDNPLCAEFAHEEVLEMLCTVLPEETALILWYNKSRATGRICPACQRLYRLGDTLPDHIDQERRDGETLPQLEREQEISGLCSPVCFILASFNHPGAIKSAWGHTADEIDDDAWEILNGPGDSHGLGAKSDMAMGLGMLVKMTRLDDLGLAQLCLGEEEEREWVVEEAAPQL